MIYAVIGLVLLFLVRGRGINQYDTNVDQMALLENALENGDIGPLLDDDDSPIAFVVPGDTGGLTKEQRIALIQESFGSYSDQLGTITDNLAVEASEAMDLIALTIFAAMDEGDELSERAIETYLDLVSIWTSLYVEINVAVSGAVADVMESAGYAIDNATECVQTAFVQDITEESTETQSQYASVTVTGKAKNGFLGIGGSNSSTKTELSGSITTRTDTRNIVYVPHCVDYEIDPVAVDAILASQTLALQALYGQITAVLAMAPDPYQLRRETETNP